MTDQSDVIKDVGIFGLKALVTLNSGAVIVLLAFLGNTYGKEGSSINIDIANIKVSMFLFLFGISTAFLSIVVTYLLAQLHQEPWVKNMSRYCLISIMVVPALLSFVFFVLGFIRTILSFT